MAFRVQAQFNDPGDSTVSLTLTAPLKRFEELRLALAREDPVPFWMISELVLQIDAASRALRSKVQPPPPPRRMVAGDILLTEDN